MMTIRQIDQIRSLYYDNGMKIADIAIKCKCTPGTASKYIKNDNFSPKPRKKSELSFKILQYEPDMIELLKRERNGHYKQRITGKRNIALF
jgi:uncharacterized protein YjcR